MENLVQRQRVLTLVIRWTARIWSIAGLGLILAFYIGEGFNPALFKPIEWLLHLFFPVGISVGMILAWWKESIGGSLTVGSLIMFYVIHFATTNKFSHGCSGKGIIDLAILYPMGLLSEAREILD